MAINNFKPFALDPNANVTSQADWEALPALLSGFTAGKASSAQVNKAIRQASFIAAALAQYTAKKSRLDVLDDGDLNGFIFKMRTAFGQDFQALDATLSALAGLATGANKLPYFTGNDTAALTDLTSVGRDIIGKNTIADILTYLGMTDILNDKQDKNDNLTSLSSLTGIPDGLAFFTGAGTMDMTALTQNGREILSKKNVSETLQYLTLGDGTGRLLGVQVFGSSGTYHKSPGVTKIIVEAVGGGGASGNLSATASNNCGVSAAGSNGAYAKAFFYQSIPESVQVTIGSGGVAGTGPGGSGGDGGNTSFGDLLVCPGGRGSTQVQQVPPFSGGSATEAPIPTGQGILFHSVSRSNLCGALGLGDDQAIGVESITTTMLGTYGIGGTGKYNKASSGPATGNNGNQGYILVWEYQ
ncbi:glycine-rich domain-containing protein [Escherichia coli]